MTQCDCLNVKLSYLHKLKSRIKNGTEVTSNLSPDLIAESNNETFFPIHHFKLMVKSLSFVKLL